MLYLSLRQLVRGLFIALTSNVAPFPLSESLCSPVTLDLLVSAVFLDWCQLA